MNRKQAVMLKTRIENDGFNRVFLAENGVRPRRYLVMIENLGTFASERDYESWQRKRAEGRES